MQIIHKYFPDLTEKQIKQFTDLQHLYGHWNAQINVISRKNMDTLYTNHILHSLAIAKVIHFEKGTKILDIGTGGGFPGIPLAILFPKVDFLLVDSIGKKIKVVNEISNAIGLTNVSTLHERARLVLNILLISILEFNSYPIWNLFRTSSIGTSCSFS